MRTVANDCEPVMKYYNDVRMMSVIRINDILKEFMTSSKRINKTLNDLMTYYQIDHIKGDAVHSKVKKIMM